jgi:hypothetical protein
VINRSVHLEDAEDTALRQLSFRDDFSKSEVMRLAIIKSLKEWGDDPTLLKREMEDSGIAIGNPPPLPPRDTGQLMKNWRGRRLLACQSVSELVAIIGNLGVEDGTQLPPSDSTSLVPSPEMLNEMENMASLLLRMILLHNDGRVSPQRLPRF